MSALIDATTTKLASFQSSMNSSVSRNMSILMSENYIDGIYQQDSSDGGRIIYVETQARGVSISLQKNTLLNINCSEGIGAIANVSFIFTYDSSVSETGDLSPEYQILVNSTNNSYGVYLC